MLTQLPRVPSLIPSSFATWAIGRDVSITIFTASSLNSGEKLFFGRGKFLPFQIVHPNGRTVRKPRGTSLVVEGAGLEASVEDEALREPAVTFMDPRRSREYAALSAGQELAASWLNSRVRKRMAAASSNT